MSRSSLLISNDTGPLHLAQAVGTPTVGIFWCGNMINAAPLVRERFRQVISWSVFCPLCGANVASPGQTFFGAKSSCGHKVCFVEDAPVDEILYQAQDLLKKQSVPKYGNQERV